MKKATKTALIQAGVFILKNWKVLTGVAAIASTSTAALMGKLNPLADAVSVAFVP